MLLLLHRPQMTSNHDLAIITLFQSTLEHALDHFLEFWIFEGVKHFFGLLNQPPTPLLTLLEPTFYSISLHAFIYWGRNYYLFSVP